ncbi:MAG: 50S ribosomal protein L10 [Thermodesulfobacteriota bacterium]
MLNLTQKKALVEELRGSFQKAAVLILTEYQGMTVEQVNELRRKLKEIHVEYRVVKNTLLRLASQETPMAPAADYFKGSTAIALGYGDPVAVAKVLTEFAKTNEKLTVKAGVMGGRLMDTSKIVALSKLPSREELLAKLLGTMNAVPTSFVRVLNGIPAKLVYALSAIKDQKAAA